MLQCSWETLCLEAYAEAQVTDLSMILDYIIANDGTFDINEEIQLASLGLPTISVSYHNFRITQIPRVVLTFTRLLISLIYMPACSLLPA